MSEIYGEEMLEKAIARLEVEGKIAISEDSRILKEGTTEGPKNIIRYKDTLDFRQSSKSKRKNKRKNTRRY